MKDRSSKSIDSLLDNAPSLKNLSQTFAILDELNKILHKFLPAHLSKHCRIGAIDNKKNLVILYLEEPSLKHIITSMANPILEHFNNHHFSFAGLMTRIRPRPATTIPRYKHLEPKARDKLQQLATSINKPGLIEDEVIKEDLKEINF